MKCLGLRADLLVMLVFVSATVSAWGAEGTHAAGSQEAGTSQPERSADWQVSVGDFRVVVKAPPWAWAVSETNHSPKTVARPGEPAYVRPPRPMPVHATMPDLARHPVTGDLVLTYCPYFDALQEHSMGGVCVSRDGGWTWTPPRLVRGLHLVGPCGRGWISTYLLTGYEPEYPNQVRVCILRSEDGLNWTEDKPEGVITFPENMKPQAEWGPEGGGPLYDNARTLRGRYKSPASVYMAMRIAEHDGALYACGYGQFAKDAPYRNFLVRSRDGGKSWRFFADIGRDYEPDFCWLASGNMIAEGRCNPSHNPRPLLQTRSTDGGRTWSKPAPAPGVELVTEADRKWYTPEGELFYKCGGANIDPVLLPMGNGVIALAYGRPGWSLRFNVDGTGNSWEYHTTILPKYAVTDGTPWAFPLGSHYTHAMGGLAALSDCTLLVTSNIYGYSPSGDPEKGRDVVFVVPVSIRRADRGNAPPRLAGPEEVAGKPGREVLVRFELTDPDGDWVKLVCPDDANVEIRGNAVRWRMPWEFQREKRITLVAEDAWGGRSTGHQLTVQNMQDGKY